MAGQPRSRAWEAHIDRLGGIDHIADRFADGWSWRRIAAEIGCSRQWLWTWIDCVPERKALLERARSYRAEALVDDAGEVVDGSANAASPAEVASAKLRSGFRTWLAAKLDSRWAEQKAPMVAITVGQLHLAALRATRLGGGELVENASTVRLLQEANSEDAQAEIVSDEVASS